MDLINMMYKKYSINITTILQSDYNRITKEIMMNEESILKI